MPRRFVFPYPRRRFFSSASPRMDDVPLSFDMPLPDNDVPPPRDVPLSYEAWHLIADGDVIAKVRALLTAASTPALLHDEPRPTLLHVVHKYVMDMQSTQSTRSKAHPGEAARHMQMQAQQPASAHASGDQRPTLRVHVN